MNERQKDKFMRHLSRFLADYSSEEKIRLDEMLNNDELDKAQIFHYISRSNGKGKSHVSAYTHNRYDYTLKKS